MPYKSGSDHRQMIMPESPPKLKRNISCSEYELTLMRSQCASLKTDYFLYWWRYVPILDCHEYCVVKPFETSSPLGYTYMTRLSTDNLQKWAFGRYFVVRKNGKIATNKQQTDSNFKRCRISTYVIRNCILTGAKL